MGIYQKIGGATNNKYGARKTEYNGVTYDSKKEADFAAELDLMRKASDPKDKVVDIERQVPFVMEVNGKKVGKYILDFKVTHADGTVRYIDVKGMKSGCAYQLFRLKKKIVEAQYSLVIEEV